MPSKTITNSGNISVLTSKIDVDLCIGKFKIDIIPTVYIGAGLSNIVGAKIRITNPYGVAIKDFDAGFDITTPLTQVYQFDIPKSNGTFQYGLYVIDVQVTEVGGLISTVTGNVTPCAPNATDKSKKFGSIIANITGNCVTGKVTVMLDQPPVYKGVLFESKTQSIAFKYPTGTLAPITFSVNAFATDLFEGVYTAKGDVCAKYNMGDNIYYEVPYKVDCEKNILCRVDLCCVYGKLDELNKELNSDCSADEIKKVTDIILDSLRLIKTIELGGSCGEDVSDYILELETLLKCRCTCSATEGTPIVPSMISNNFAIEGCNVEKNTVGSTDFYTINNYEYVVSVNPASSFMTVSAPALVGCVKTQQLTFSVALFYEALKTVINNDTEYNYWGSIINNNLLLLPAGLLTCLGVTSAAWDALTFRDKFLLVLSTLCNLSSTGSCDAVISAANLVAVGPNETISWTNGLNAVEIDIYIDSILRETVLAPVNSYTFPVTGINPHTYRLVSKCANGAPGVILTGSFTNAGCATIPAVSLSTNNVTAGACPYDLTTLAPAPAPGFTIEWHNLNNRNASSLVPTPTAVTSGTYYAFRVENATQCSSVSSSVIITCAVAGNCTEPLSLSAVEVAGGNVQVSFSSAATPPSSYLVKRRLASDPDITGSYTTIGTPVFNISTNKWEITTAQPANILYVYKAESQCGDGSRPYSTFTYAKIACPVVTFTPAFRSIGYSFNPLGGSVDKYIFDLYDNSGTTLLRSNTILPTFTTPITGSFNGLSPSATSYKVVLRAFIGLSFVKVCDFANQTTLAGTPTGLTAQSLINGGFVNGLVDDSWVVYGSDIFPAAFGVDKQFGNDGFSGDIYVNATTPVDARVEMYINGALSFCDGHAGTGAQVYFLGSITFSASDIIIIKLVAGSSCP